MYDTGDRDITETKIWIFCPSRTFWKICPKIIQICSSIFFNFKNVLLRKVNHICALFDSYLTKNKLKPNFHSKQSFSLLATTSP